MENMEKVNNFEERYLEFKTRLFDRLNSSNVEITNDVVSMYDVFNAVSNKFGFFNAILLDNLDKEIRTMNMNNGYVILPDSVKRKNRKIGDVKFHIQEDGYYYCEVVYVDETGKEIGRTTVDNTIKVGNADNEVLRNKKYFVKYLDYLGVFASINHNMEYVWDRKNPYVKPEIIGDGFLNAKLDLNNLKRGNAHLASSKDLVLATYHYPKKGELADYIDFYNEEFMKKTPIELDSLNPFVQKIVREQYELEKGKTKELVK